MSKSVFVVSECGTGKSLMGAVIAHVVGQQTRRDYRVLVVGPPHLTGEGSGKGVTVKVRRPVAVCPRCGNPITDSDGVPVEDGWIHKAQRTCKGFIQAPDNTQRPCGERLWSYTWPSTRDGLPDNRKP